MSVRFPSNYRLKISQQLRNYVEIITKFENNITLLSDVYLYVSHREKFLCLQLKGKLKYARNTQMQ